MILSLMLDWRSSFSFCFLRNSLRLETGWFLVREPDEKSSRIKYYLALIILSPELFVGAYEENFA
jgi:hypothetical protein